MKVLLIDQIAKVNYKYSYSLANALADAGADISLAIDQKSDNDKLKCSFTQLFNTDEKGISRVSKLINYISSWKIILNMIRTEYDVVHTQWVIFSPLDYIYLMLVKRQGKKIVLTIHDILPFNKKFYDYYFHKKIYDLADDIIIQTDENVNRFHQLFPNNSRTVTMVPHGHFLEYAQTFNKQEARKHLGIINKFTYLFFGQIKDVKGVDVLLQAYSKLLSSDNVIKDNTQLVIAGSVWKTDYSKCADIIEENGISQQVIQDIRFIPDKDVDYYYSAADVCVLPYKEVYQSGVLQLTYAHRKVAIVTNIPAFTEIIDEDKGFICNANDIQSLSDAMKEAYLRADTLTEMSDNGYNYIASKYGWDKIAEKISIIYNGYVDEE